MEKDTQFNIQNHPYFDSELKYEEAVIFGKHDKIGEDISHFSVMPDIEIALNGDLEALLKEKASYENYIIEKGVLKSDGLDGFYIIASDPISEDNDGNARRYRAIAKIDGFDFVFFLAGFCEAVDLDDFKIAINAIISSIKPDRSFDAKKEVRPSLMAKLKNAMNNFDKLRPHINLNRTDNNEKSAIDDRDTITRLNDAINSCGLEEKRDAIRALAMPAIRMIENGEANSDLGQSRIGGGPDLAPDTLWPRDSQGFYYNFLAQINLADIVDNQDYLPQQGLISLFYGNDGDDWHVMFNVDYYNFIRHDIADDAEDITFAAHNMVGWESDGNGGYRGVVTNKKRGDIEAQLDEDGRFAFYRDGQKLMAFASEQEIPRSCQKLKFLPCICLPYYFDKNVWQGIDFRRSLDLAIAVRDEMTFGEGPQHQMFGTYADAVSDIDGTICVKAAAYAKQQGWNDLEDDDWFILCALQGGGEVDFQFWDLGCFIIAANRKDTIKGDFSRTYAAIDSA